MVLYDYFRSSAAYRVRIALNLKGLDYEQRPISLLKSEQRANLYERINPQGLVPALQLENGIALTQSLAICEYLEENTPEPPILPADATGRARVRALAQLVACDVHPLNNLRVLQYLTQTLNISEEAKKKWQHHWVAKAFTAYERLLGSSQTGTCSHRDTPTLADVCLVPQIASARRFRCDLAPYPKILQVEKHCEGLTAFQKARPSEQPGAF